MTRSDYFWSGRLLICLWITILFINESQSRRNDKCTTGDGGEGVCVLKRFCREASHHDLLPCENDEINHCCPIPTQKSAAFPPLSVTGRPGEEDPYRPTTKPRRPDTDAPRSPPRYDPPNKAPPEEESRNNFPRPPHPDPNKYNGRDAVTWQPGRDQGGRPPGRDQGGRQPDDGSPVNRDHSNRVPNTDIRAYHTTSTPRWKIFEKVPEPKNRSTVDTSRFPITFPGTFSVPSPKVPACGVKPYDLFIAGGQESAEHEWPWMTAIFRRYPDSRSKTFLCGGSLINTKYVLTAAHCFVNNYVILPASSFVVRLGSHFLDSGEEYTVSNLVIHSNHSGTDFFNDIALIRLASEVYVTDKIAPICLPSPDMIRQSLVGRLATVAGWGDTAFRTAGTRILQHVTVPIVSGEECFAAYSRVRGAAFLARGSDHVVCAGLREGGKDACLGDSGGPLMIRMSDDRWIIVGIVSLGYKCAEPGYPGVYTRVTHYLSWINSNMKRY